MWSRISSKWCGSLYFLCILRSAYHCVQPCVSGIDAEIEAFKNKNIWLTNDIESLRASADGLRKQCENARTDIDGLLNERAVCEKESTDLRNLEKEKNSERENVSGELARLEERKATMLNEFEEYNSKLYDEYQLTRREAIALEIVIENIGEARTRLSALKNEIRGLGSVNVSAIDEYKEVSERYEFMSEQIGDVEKSKAELIRLIDDLTTKMSVQFREQFQKINIAFGETFAELFGGGKAELVLEDEMISGAYQAVFDWVDPDKENTTAEALQFQVSDKPEYIAPTYGVVTIEKGEGYTELDPVFDIGIYTDEADYAKQVKDPNNTVYLEFRGNFGVHYDDDGNIVQVKASSLPDIYGNIYNTIKSIVCSISHSFSAQSYNPVQS